MPVTNTVRQSGNKEGISTGIYDKRRLNCSSCHNISAYPTIKLCWGSYFESTALQATNYLTLGEVELQQTPGRRLV